MDQCDIETLKEQLDLMLEIGCSFEEIYVVSKKIDELIALQLSCKEMRAAV